MSDHTWLEWAVAARPMQGEDVSGDGSLVLMSDAEALIVGVDGLGHGSAAEAVTALALAAVREDPLAPLEALAQRCHERLAGTRGVALSLVRVSAAGRVQWLGVGNVECLLVRARDGSREAAPLRGGVVGYRLPALRVNEVDITPGDLLVIATDGITSSYADKPARVGAVRRMADDILARHGKLHDDVLVLVARFLGARG